ncbi:hypothetical protein, partial [Marinitenerispora sediminis]
MKEPNPGVRELVAHALLRATDPEKDRTLTAALSARLASAMFPGDPVLEGAAAHARRFQGTTPPRLPPHAEEHRAAKVGELRKLLADADDPARIGFTAARLAQLTLYGDTVMDRAAFHAEYVRRYGADVAREDPATIRGAAAQARALAHLAPGNVDLREAAEHLRRVREAIDFSRIRERASAADVEGVLNAPGPGASVLLRNVYGVVRDLYQAEAQGRREDAGKAAERLTGLLKSAAGTPRATGAAVPGAPVRAGELRPGRQRLSPG